VNTCLDLPTHARTQKYSNTCKRRTSRLHAALANLLWLVPKAKTELFPIIHADAPFRTRSLGEIRWYYTQALRTLKYIPSMEAALLELAVDRSLEMDVEIKITDTGDATLDRDEPQDDEGIFHLDMDTPPVSDTNKEQLGLDVTVDEMADKLDAMMLLLLEHVKNSSNLTVTYEILLDIFSNSILVTHKSKFVQFLLFYICWLGRDELVVVDQYGGEEYMDRAFMSSLIQVLLSTFKSKVTRQTSACYLASFVSRADFCTPESVCQALHVLLVVAEAYARGTENVTAGDARDQSSLHSFYYTVTQAAFYIMCFRGKEAWEYYQGEADADTAAETDIGPALWKAVCCHQLNPLKHCLESVRVEFLQLAEVYNLIPHESRQAIVERLSVKKTPKRRRALKISTPATLEMERRRGGVGGLGQGSNPLDSFFPFDPYLLRESHSYFEPIYRHWEDSAVANLGLDDKDEATDHNSQHSDVSLDENDTDKHDDEGEEEGDDDSEVDSIGEDTASHQPMSFTSRGSGFAESLPRVHVELGMDFAETMKRPRAQSIENGSLW
jgi:RNA polymerase I-specific transcription initiation factor RRN3